MDNIEEYQKIYNHAWKKHKSGIQNEKKVDEIIEEYLIEEINQNKLMSKKHKKICEVLNSIDHLFCCNSYNYWMCFHFCFCFLSWYSNRNYEFCIWIKNLYSIEVLISKALIDSNIGHDQIVLINNVLKSKIPITNKSLNYMQNNVILLFEVWKKYAK